MPVCETEAFTLRTYPYSEAHKVCIFFTHSFGLVRAVAYGSRSLKKSSFGVGLEMFAQVQLRYYEKEGRELGRLENCDTLKSYFHLASNPDITVMLSCWSELIIEFFPPHQPNEILYRLITTLLPYVEDSHKSTTNLFRYFEIWILKLSGFLPSFKNCMECNYSFTRVENLYMNRDGSVICKECKNSNSFCINSNTMQMISDILCSHPLKFISTSFTLETNNLLSKLTCQLIKFALEKELKSYRILEQFKII